MVKKVIIWVGLTSFLFQALLFNAMLLLSWEYAKHESETAVAHGKLIIPTQTYKKLNWLNEHEFLIGKYLCDVYKKTENKGQIAFIFKVDEKEKGLIEKLADHFSKSRAKKDIPTPVFFFSVSPVSIVQQIPISSLAFKINFSDKLANTDSLIDSPPPRV
jgi:hypothetical protein